MSRASSTTGRCEGPRRTRLGLPAGHVAATAFRRDLLLPTITGRCSFDQWYAAISAALKEVVPESARVHEHMRRWRGRPFGCGAELFTRA